MAISAGHIVALSSRVISGGGTDLQTNGLLLTKSPLIPASKPAMLFSSAAAVAEMFGPESQEADFAQQYFTGVTNQQKGVETLVVARRIDTDAAAWVRGGSVDAELADFKKVKDGTFSLILSGATKTASAVDLSGATSYSDVAEKIATALTGVTGTYDSNLKSFTFTTEATGENATVGFVEAASAAVVGAALVDEAELRAAGTDLTAMLAMSEAAGAVLSQGANAQTETENLNAVCEVTRNWVGFTTLWETEEDEAKAFAAWTDATGDDFIYVDWTTDENAVSQLAQEGTKPAKLLDLYNCTACVYGDYHEAAFVLAVGASIAWTREQGMKVWFAKTASGLAPRITTETQADALEAIRCSYLGEFATRNDRFNFFNRGTLTSDFYGFIDVLYGSIYLRNAIQVSAMNGFKNLNRVPYNSRGEALILAWCQDPINRCLMNGVIDPGLALNESQKAQILMETGGDESVINAIQSRGYWVGVTLPDAAGRANRESPVVTVMYAYAGSVQSLSAEVVTII